MISCHIQHGRTSIGYSSIAHRTIVVFAVGEQLSHPVSRRPGPTPKTTSGVTSNGLTGCVDDLQTGQAQKAEWVVGKLQTMGTQLATHRSVEQDRTSEVLTNNVSGGASEVVGQVDTWSRGSSA
jgi:hypothetical protein